MSAPLATSPAGTAFEHLLSPFDLGAVHLRNRVVWLPHLTGYADEDGLVTDRHIGYYEARARGGVGLIVTGCPPGSGRDGRGDAGSSRVVDGYRWLTEAVHAQGAAIVGQITDDGYRNDGLATLDWHVHHAPSSIPGGPVEVMPRAMTEADIAEAIEHLARSARQHELGGFDGIELQAARDGLGRQFASPLTNYRTDRWGGSRENRLRFLRESVCAVRDLVGPDFVVGIRLSLDEGLPGGYDASEGVELARAIGAWGTVNYLSADDDLTSDLSTVSSAMKAKQAAYLELGRRAFEASGLPLVAFGRIRRPEQAETVLRDGYAQLVGMARQLIADSDWVRKVEVGDAAQIRPCIGCDQACLGRLEAGAPITCVVNPSAGRERRWGADTLRPADAPKDVVVVGAGPAGLKAAEVAALRGHRVRVLDRRPAPGGRTLDIARLAIREEFAESTAWMAGQLERLGVPVITGVVLAPDNFAMGDDRRVRIALADEDVVADEIVVATGAVPRIPEIEGAEAAIDLPHAFHREWSSDQRVVVWDEEGGQPAASVAEYIASSGADVTIVTPADHPAGGLVRRHLTTQLRRLYELGVRVVPYARVAALRAPIVVVANVYNGVESILDDDVDVVVHAVGWRADDRLYLALRDRLGACVHRVGDCVAPRDAAMAIYSGEELGRAL